MSTTVPQPAWSERVVASWREAGISIEHGDLGEIAWRAWEEFSFMEPELYARAKLKTWESRIESGEADVSDGRGDALPAGDNIDAAGENRDRNGAG